MPIMIATNNSLNIVKEDGEVMVVSKDGQFRNSYKNAWHTKKLYGIGVFPDGSFVDITKDLSIQEMDWLYQDSIRFRALFLRIN